MIVQANYQTGATLDFFAYNAAGQVYDAIDAAWETWADADYQRYRHAAAEVGASGRYTGTVPDATARYEMRLRQATLAASEVVWTEVVTTLSDVAVDAILDRTNGVETGWSLRRALRIMFAALAGKSSGHASGAPVYRDVPDTKNRITATTDGDGNRSAVTLDGT